MSIDKFLLQEDVDLLRLELTMLPTPKSFQESTYQQIYHVEYYVLWLYVFFAGWAAVFEAIGVALGIIAVIAAFTTAVAVVAIGITIKGLP